MTVAVTGATGFIGGHLHERLAADGLAVRALVRPGTDAASLEAAGAAVVRGGLLDPAALRRAFEGAATAVHLAGLTGRHGASPEAYREANVEGTRAVVRAARDAGVRRVVIASTVGVYGRVAHPPADERTPARPNTPYRASKYAAELAALEEAQRGGPEVVVVRLPSTLGPRAVSWLGWCRALTAGRFRLLGHGRNRVHVADVADVVDGLCRAARADGIAGERYVLAGPDPVPFRAFASLWAEALGTAVGQSPMPALPFRLLFRAADHAHRRLGIGWARAHTYEFLLADRAFSTAKAERDLGFRPRLSTREAVRRTVQSYAEQGRLPSPLARTS